MLSNEEISLSFEVRDYECDLIGVVNNATFQNYLEHARHEYLKSMSIDFAEMGKIGIGLVVMKAQLEYKHPLTSGDKFYIKTKAETQGKFKVKFTQNVYKSPDDKHALSAEIIGAAINQKTEKPELIDKIFELSKD